MFVRPIYKLYYSLVELFLYVLKIN